ncbi:hypothetical protein PR048_022171 [Dryococelus australis]|uniref:Endonuclease/exonuclease/phosphatase domain-containing protein n=1 Tax=Dryococelus australis TaxID=614101 RepID=A0ABQ9H0I1_9NEOP|nr:hypothetical protein PR048_022171 [Dryococelus australis]
MGNTLKRTFCTKENFLRKVQISHGSGKRDSGWVNLIRDCGRRITHVSQARDTEDSLDVTLGNRKAPGLVTNWKVTEHSSSDHRLIIFEVGLPVGRQDHEQEMEWQPEYRFVHN